MSDTFLVTDAIAEKFDIPVQEVSGMFDDYESPFILGRNTVDDLKAFADAVGSKVVLVEYNYVDGEELIVDISDEALEGLFGEGAGEAADIIAEHNDAIMAEDWEAPYAVNVFVMHEGQPFGIKVYNDVYEDDLLIDPEDYIVCLLDGCDEEE